jgi:hypothetical protein
MTRKPTTKSPEERRLRKHIRELLQVHAAAPTRLNTDAAVREFLNLIDDEVRRTRMSMAPAVNPRDDVVAVLRDYSGTGFAKPRKDHGGILFEDEPKPMTDEEWKERVEIKKAIATAALNGRLPFTCGGK